VQNCFGERGET